MINYVNLAGTQLVGRCTYNNRTGKAAYESFEKYYPTTSKELFK